MADIDRLLEDLTPPQRAAATHVDGPLLIVAGAGSGKTRVITRRVAYLIAKGVRPSSILAITFTNKASAEMKQRIAAVADRPLRDFGRLDQPWPMICTFHSLCLRILRHYAERVGLPANFSIFDTSDQNKVVKEALKMLDINTTNFSPATVHATISNAKNQLVDAEAFARKAGDFYQRTVARVYTKYQQLLKQNNALDFDDLLLRTAQAMRDHPQVLHELQDRFQYLLIDEYQDTNHAQYVLAHALAQRHQNLCVVGDPDQSIYAWRGADLQNILDFEKDYPNAKIIRLEQNYRSTKRILRIASELIAHNSERKDKTLWTENDEGEPARLFLCQDEHDEASIIMQQLRDLHDKHGYDWNRMAIFYRMNSLSRVMEGALLNAGIPYQIARGTEFYNRKEIKDVLAYLRVIANPSDEVSLSRIANVPARGLGDAALKLMSAHAVANGIGLWEAMENASRVPGVSARAISAAGQFVQLVKRWRKMAYILDGREVISPPPIEGETPQESGRLPMSSGPDEADGPTTENAGGPPVPRNVPSGEVDLFSQFDASDDPFGPTDSATLDEIDLHDSGSSDEGEEGADVVEPSPAAQRFQPAPIRGGVRAIAEAVIRQSGLEDYLKKIGGEELDELNNVNELITSTAEFDNEHPDGSLDDFLAQISLVSDADHLKGSGGAITLMTLHAAKGLEFPVVAMIGLEEGILPHSRSRGNPRELEEERRLCFVGMTRAQERLILSKAASRTVRGITERTIPSPFLGEIPLKDIEVVDRMGVGAFSTRRSGGGLATNDGRVRPSIVEPPAPKISGRFSHVREGQLVRHPQYGLGRIKEVARTGDDRTRAVVRFNQEGEKVFYLELAQLDVID